MRSSFSEQIRALRKARHTTQEQLAEAMGVSPGAVYKWEQGLSTPDLGMIMDLARYFGVSVDALVGYRICADERQRILEQLKQIRLEKSCGTHWPDLEDWLRRYPNQFDIVYGCAELYYLDGAQRQDRRELLHAISLLERSAGLIDQNTDLTRTDIERKIGIAYLDIGKTAEGLAKLKANNPCGINSDLIGLELSEQPENRREAWSWLGKSVLDCTVRLDRTADGLLNLLLGEKNPGAAAQLLEWVIAILRGLELPGKTSFIKKDLAIRMAQLAAIRRRQGEVQSADDLLRTAWRTAREFDADPDYSTQYVRYCEGAEIRTSFDSNGATATEAVETALSELTAEDVRDGRKEADHEEK